MKKWILHIALLVESVLLLIALLVGLFMYNVKAKQDEIFCEDSPDSKYTLVIWRIGEPDWPFGPDHLRIMMFEKDKTSNYSVDFQTEVSSDGAHADYKVEWLEDGAKVTLIGEEQLDTVHILPFKQAET